MFKVLFIDHESLLGGAEKSMVDIVRNMPKDKILYTVAIAGEGELATELRKAGIKDLFFLPMDGWRWWETGFINRVKLVLSFPIQLLNIIRWCILYKRIKPDIIHFNLTRLVEPVIAAYLCNIKTIMHFREFIDNNKSFGGGNRIYFILMRLCTFWVANSKNTFNEIKNHRPNSILIENGIEVTAFKNYNKASIIKHTDKRFVIGMLATLVPWKNHQFYFQLIKEITKKRRDILFIIAGKGLDQYTLLLKKTVEDLGIAEQVLFTGFVNDNISLINSLDILVHTSTKESFGRIYIEAMACQKPIIALSGGAAGDVIINKKTGFLFEETELTEMANCVCMLLDNRILREQIGKNGFEHVEQNFSIEKCCNEIEKLYELAITK